MMAADYRRLGRRAFCAGRIIERLPMTNWRERAYREGYINEMRAWVAQCGSEGLTQRGPYKLIPRGDA